MKIDVVKVAKLANLPLKEDEKEKFESQLSSVLDYVNKLKEIDTKNVEPTSQVTGLENVTREDEKTPSGPEALLRTSRFSEPEVRAGGLSQDEALSNIPLRQGSEGQAKSKHNGLFKVTAVLKQSSHSSLKTLRV